MSPPPAPPSSAGFGEPKDCGMGIKPPAPTLPVLFMPKPVNPPPAMPPN